MKFEELWLKDFILANLSQKWYTEPTQIQLESIKAFDEWRNILWQSNTGSGKTGAFAIPILNHIDPNIKKPQAIILTPTRELAMQIQEDIHEMTKWTRIFTGLVAGGMSMQKQKENLKRGVHIVVGTPGRVKDFLDRKVLLPHKIKYFVLDEADRMLDMGFVDEVEEIWSSLGKIEQTLCFSATTNDELKRILDKHTNGEYTTIKVHSQPVVELLDHSFIFTPYDKKLATFEAYLKEHTQDKIVIFTQTKAETAHLHDHLKIDWFDVYQLHGDIKQYDRTRTTKWFKTNKRAILIATDVASRWLNLKDIDLVVNRDVPQDPESYIHRIGRTARAGKSGRAIMFVNKEGLSKLTYIEKKNKLVVKEIDIYGNLIETRTRPTIFDNKFGRNKRPSWGQRRPWFGFKPDTKKFGERSRSGDRSRWSDFKKPSRWSKFDNRASYGKSRFDKPKKDKDGLFEFDNLRDYSLNVRQKTDNSDIKSRWNRRDDRFDKKRFDNRSDTKSSKARPYDDRKSFHRSGSRSKR